MSHGIVITPAGRLLLVAHPEEQPPLTAPVAAVLCKAFDESSAAGLVQLATHAHTGELPPPLLFWRDWSRRLFQAACQLGETEAGHWARLPAPDAVTLDALVAEAPPMRGLEYLDAELLRRLWTELAEHVAAQAKKHPLGPVGYLQQVDPLWRLLGRVTFHLAENKRDPGRPFAFLASYTHRLSSKARLQHLPLAEALKAYAGANDRAQLEALLEPVRRAAERSVLVRELIETKSLFAPQAWTIRQAYQFLSDAANLEEAGVVVRLPDWWTGRRPPRPQVEIRIGETRASEVGVDQLLKFDVRVSIDGEPLTDEEIQSLRLSSEGMALLRGKWVEVNRQQLDQALKHWQKVAQEHADGISFIEGMRLLAGAELASDEAIEPHMAAWSRVTAGNWLRETLERLRHLDQDDGCRPGRNLNATLRPYQAEGVRWLWFLTELGLGACLADDMGLGKTIQVIDLFLQRRHSRPKGQPPHLLVVPASLVGNWRAEFERFGPGLRVYYAHRSETDAARLVKLAKHPDRELTGYDAVVTTYQLVRRETWWSHVCWGLVVLDEAQAIKNATSQQSRSIKKLDASGRIVLTGTPVENHLGDMWSLFDFCNPGLLGTAADFKRFVKRLRLRQDTHAFATLRSLVRPYILRRLKTDRQVAPDLPDKTEMRVDCSLARKQAVLYEQAVDTLAKRLDELDGMARRGLVLATLMQLKQICNHPAQYLSSGAFEPRDSGKFERLRSLCEPISARQEKALVFTQFQSLCEPLAEYLATLFGRPGLVLHGGTAVRKRTERVKQFQTDDGPPFFVISLKAGGSGLNLTAASHVIHFDRWWNPAVENQATDRAFRIGQNRNVLVHKFVCRGTVEERIDAMIASKQAVADQVLSEDGEARITEMSDDALLRFVALDIGRAASEED